MSAYPDVDNFFDFLLPSASDAERDFAVPMAVAELLVYGSDCFTTYEALSGSEKTLFDQAAGYRAAYLVYNRPTSTTTIGTGAVKKKTQDGLSIEYDVGTTTKTVSTSASWLAEYERLLALLCPEAQSLNTLRRASVRIPVSTLPNSADPRDSLFASDVERAEGAGSAGVSPQAVFNPLAVPPDIEEVHR